MQNKVIDRLWLWCHTAGCYNKIKYFQNAGGSHLTPIAACRDLGLGNALMVRYHNRPNPAEFRDYAQSLSPLQNVIWSLVGDKGSSANDRESDLQHVLALARDFQNIRGGILDDFFSTSRPSCLARMPLDRLKAEKEALASHGLKLWSVVYDMQYPFDAIRGYLEIMDVITYWSWGSGKIAELERNIEKIEAAAPGKDICLGCYLWNFGGGENSPLMPIASLEYQCRKGLEWLESGRIKGIIFLGNGVCGVGLESQDWLRNWIKKVGERPLP